MSNLQPALSSRRLILEPLREQHASLLFEGLADSALYTYVPQDAPSSVAALLARFAAQPSRPDERWWNWAVRHRHDREFVGVIETTLSCDSAYLAYFVFHRRWRQGLGREACWEVLRYLFAEVGIFSASAEVDTRNAKSIRLLEALGFRRTSEVKAADFFKGTPSDEFRYELTRDELITDLRQESID